MEEREFNNLVRDLYFGRCNELTSDDCKRIYAHLSRLHAVYATANKLGWSSNLREKMAALRDEYHGPDYPELCP